MSHFVECQAEFRDPQALIAALGSLKLSMESVRDLLA